MAWAAAGSGWVVAGLLPLQVALPYLLRGRLLVANGRTIPYLERLRPHYWIGVTIAGLTLVHAGLAMSDVLPTGGTYVAGLWIATGGMFLAGGQVYIGMKMRSLRGTARIRLRKTHFRVMLALIAAGVLHIAMNGAMLRAIFSA